MISIIIPTCNRPDLLDICLKSLAPDTQLIASNFYEIIVSDDSNNEDTRELIENNYNWIRYIKGPRNGPAANRNKGANQANGQWLMFLDDDCIPSENIIKNYLNFIKENPNVLVFEGAIHMDRPKQRFDEECPVNDKGGFLWSCNFMIWKELFLQDLNGFDETFPYAAMEDVDLYYRIKKAEIKSIFANNASVIHPWRIQLHIKEMTFKRFYSMVHFLKKHPETQKQYPPTYFFRIGLFDLIVILKNGWTFKFKGLKGTLLRSVLHTYIGLFFLYKKIFKISL